MNENNDTFLFISIRKLSLFSFLCLRINPLTAELNPVCHLLALLGAHYILHVSRKRVKSNFNKKYTWEDCISNPSNLEEFLIISSITRKIVQNGKKMEF